MNELTEKAMYLCNGGKKCGGHPNCYVNGGECSFTRDISHAAGFKRVEGVYEGQSNVEYYVQKECVTCCSE